MGGSSSLGKALITFTSKSLTQTVEQSRNTSVEPSCGCEERNGAAARHQGLLPGSEIFLRQVRCHRAIPSGLDLHFGIQGKGRAPLETVGQMPGHMPAKQTGRATLKKAK